MMMRKGVLIALLDPEDVFRDTLEEVGTEVGVISIVGNKLDFYYEVEEHARRQEGLGNVYGALNAFLSTLALVTRIGVGYRTFDWVELIDGELVSAPAMVPGLPPRVVDSSAVSRTKQLFQLVVSDWRLQRALADFRTALRHEGHELIFLYRCIEWLKWRFGGWDELRRELSITKNELNSIKQEANSRYMARHATQDEPQPVPLRVRDAAFKNAELILHSYMDYLRSRASSGP